MSMGRVKLLLPQPESVKTTQHPELGLAIASFLGPAATAAGDREDKAGAACDQEEAEQEAAGGAGHGGGYQTISRGPGAEWMDRWWKDQRRKLRRLRDAIIARRIGSQARTRARQS